MHVAIVTTSYPLTPDSTSGIFIKRLVDSLPGDVTRTIITPCPDSRPRPHETVGTRIHCIRYAPRAWQRISHKPGGIPVALKGNRWFIMLLPIMLLAMFTACVRIGRQADLIHANWSLNGLIAGIAGLLTGTPVITTLRGSDVEGLENSFTRRQILAGCIALNSRIITVSDAICTQARALFPKYAAKFAAIPNGVGDEFMNIGRAETASSGQILSISSIGNLSRNKRMDTVIRAALAMGGNRRVVHIVGDGPEREALEHAAADSDEHGVTVELHGALPPGEIPRILAGTDILVLASRSEGRPNVLLEAMAAGLPVVASDIEGVRELVTDSETGLLFESGNADQLATQLARLRDDPELRARLGAAAREFIIRNGLTWQQCATAYREIYTSVAKHEAETG
jgi:glycosyltransferase involved in cell wall biosynthesis